VSSGESSAFYFSPCGVDCCAGCPACLDRAAFDAASVKVILAGIVNGTDPILGCTSTPGCDEINGEYTLDRSAITLTGSEGPTGGGYLAADPKPGTYCMWVGILAQTLCKVGQCVDCDESEESGCASLFLSGSNTYESQAACLAAPVTCGEIGSGADWSISAPTPIAFCESIPCEVDCVNIVDCDNPPEDLSCGCEEISPELWQRTCTGATLCNCTTLPFGSNSGKIKIIQYIADDDQVRLFAEIRTHDLAIFRGEHAFIDGESNPVEAINCLTDWPEDITLAHVSGDSDLCNGFTSIGLEVVS